MKSFRIYYAIILLFLFIAFVSAHYYFTFVLLITFLLMPIFTFIIALINKCNLDIFLDIESNVENSATNYFVSLKNKSIFPISQCSVKIEVYNKFLGTEELRIIKCPVCLRDTLDIKLEFMRTLCGVYDFKITEVKVIDYLGIFSFKKKIGDISISDVYVGNLFLLNPKEEFVSEFYDADSDRYSQKKKGDDNTEIFQIREYQSGDDIRRVHWKLSAIHNKTMVKDYSFPVSMGLFIFLDVQNNNEYNSDKKASIIIQLFMSLIYGLLENDAICTVIYYDTVSGSMVQKRVDNQEVIYEIISSILICNYNDYVFENETINMSDKNINNIIYLTTKTDYNSDILDKVNSVTFVSSSDSAFNIAENNESHRFMRLDENNIFQVANEIFDIL